MDQNLFEEAVKKLIQGGLFNWMTTESSQERWTYHSMNGQIQFPGGALVSLGNGLTESLQKQATELLHKEALRRTDTAARLSTVLTKRCKSSVICDRYSDDGIIVELLVQEAAKRLLTAEA